MSGSRARSVRLVRWALLAPALILLAGVPGSMHAAAGQAGRPDALPRSLAGAIDIHVHSAPDSTPRSVDAIEAAKLAHAAGMRAIVLKNHYDPTAGLAAI